MVMTGRRTWFIHGMVLSTLSVACATLGMSACHSGDFRQFSPSNCPDQNCSACPFSGGDGGAGGGNGQGGSTGGGGGGGAGLVVDPVAGLVLHLRLD
jgi:uncharacterized membrane protein YgcG